MLFKRKCETLIVLVTFENNLACVERVKQILKHGCGVTLTVVDNSRAKYKSRYKLRRTLKVIDSNIVYIDHKINCRFAAYNKGLKTVKSPYTMFRTDDDTFNEDVAFKIIADGFDEDFIFTPYFYNGELNESMSHKRPLETLILKSASLKKVLPFDTKPASDWRLLERLFNTQRYSSIPGVLLHKKLHGRETA